MVHRRLTFTLLLTGFFFLSGLLLSAQHADPSRIVPEKRMAWIQAALVNLKSFPADTTLPRIEIQEVAFEDYYRLKIRLKESGVLLLSGRERIYFLSSSSHSDPETGDLILAMDNKGRIFRNDGHVCGGIIHFETGKIRKVKKSGEFFKYFVSDTDGEGWKRIY